MNSSVKLSLLLLLSIISLGSFAQSWDIGGFVGGAAYMGDLNPVNPLKVNNLAFGAQVKRNFNPHWSLKLNFVKGKVEAYDGQSDSEQQRIRNLSFFSPVNEISLQTEFNFFKYVPSFSRKRYTPFLYAGLGMVTFNPKTIHSDGNTYELNLLGTEGQDFYKPYNTYALVIPYGGGVKYNISGNWSLIAEAGYRTAYTDYLDDVSGKYASPASLVVPNDPQTTRLRQELADRSVGKVGVPGTQRGDFRTKDTYMFVGLSITYSIFSQKCPVVE
ncbi:DUF6089 family protein [Pedobacter sp. SYSU D00535]|uniref:type IX secretion system protein PorG n=1 Tax=Pedobacter sp. SYSU D00535 TaxID=2810308 RepID=UPI001A9786A6|nr:DUF6089 family protein [Pedobacter sp. SYSU D00535]